MNDLIFPKQKILHICLYISSSLSLIGSVVLISYIIYLLAANKKKRMKKKNKLPPQTTSEFDKLDKETNRMYKKDSKNIWILNWIGEIMVLMLAVSDFFSSVYVKN